MKLTLFTLLILCLTLTGCTTTTKRIPFSERLKHTSQTSTATDASFVDLQNKKAAPLHPSNKQRFSKTPDQIAYADVAPLIVAKKIEDDDAEKNIELSIDNLPIPAFIQEVYGQILGVDYEISPRLKNKKDLVTLRISTPKSKAEITELATQILSNYGISTLQQGDLLRFITSKKIASKNGQPPLLITGQTLPEVPADNRIIFQVITLTSVTNREVVGWVSHIYKGFGLEIKEDSFRNNIILIGTPAIVAQATRTVKLFDRPVMRGRHSEVVKPLYLSVETLTQDLRNILSAQGYAVATNSKGIGPILLLPIESRGILILFVADPNLLPFIKEWIETLDVPADVSGDAKNDGTFIYKVRQTNAENLGDLVDQLLSAGAGRGSRTTSKSKSAKKASVRTSFLRTNSQNGKIVVDLQSNSIIYQGKQDRWQRILPIIKTLDVPTRQVLIEVTIAEITLNDSEEFGIEWLMNGSIGNYDYSGGTLGGLGLGSAGLSFALDSAGQTKAVLSALASNQKVNILSTPRIMVRSGTEASMEVGNEIPILTSQSTTDQTEGGTSAILQEIQYRKTGVLLQITPIIYGDNRIDINISQEISSATDNATSTIDSPVVLNRNVQTSLTLTDGGSVLLGGIVLESTSKGNTGVPILKDIPLIGSFFKVQEDTTERTELIMQVIAYIVDPGNQSEQLTEAVIRNMEKAFRASDERVKKTLLERFTFE